MRVMQGSFHVVTHYTYASVTVWLLKTKALPSQKFETRTVQPIVSQAVSELNQNKCQLRIA
jgi:hypothetical protein